MLLPYCVYLLVGAFYYFWLASLATVAAGIGALPILAFFGSILLFGVSGSLT